MRISEPIKQEVQGNVEKYDSYREAWARIRQAQDSGFFLEAITIQESIISDRLISFLSRPGASHSFINSSDKKKFLSLNELIQAWKKECSEEIEYPKSKTKNLIEEVNSCHREVKTRNTHQTS
jgi:hypothetical protein